MKLEEIKLGSTVEVKLGGWWTKGRVDAVNPPNKVYPTGYVQVDVGFVWLGEPDNVREPQ